MFAPTHPFKTLLFWKKTIAVITFNIEISYFNTLFYERPITRGSYISYITDPSTNLEYTKILWNINKVYTSNDYKLVFYDLFSFVSCFLGNSSIRNATWDTTLGWILGFRKMTEYNLSKTNVYYE